MQLLRLLSRVAFICNICFVLASFIQWIPHWLPRVPEEGLESNIIILGYLVAILVNVVVNVWVLVILLLRLFGRKKIRLSPLWLIIVNFLFFSAQIIIYVTQ